MENTINYKKHIKNLVKYQYLKTLIEINKLINNSPLKLSINKSSKNTYKTSIKVKYQNKTFSAFGESPNRFKSMLRAKKNIKNKILKYKDGGLKNDFNSIL